MSRYTASHGALMALGALTGAASTIVVAWLTNALIARMKTKAAEMARVKMLKDLPQDLSTWRLPLDENEDVDINEAEEKIWQTLEPLLRDEGLTPFEQRYASSMVTPHDSWSSANGYQYALPVRDITNTDAGSVLSLQEFIRSNGLKMAARTQEGQDVVLRVITINNEGREHLELLRQLATSPTSLLSDNHVLPMLREIHYEHLTIGVFPKVAQSMWYALLSMIWARNSVGDMLNMIMQALDGLAFIHKRGVVHRDAFSDNWLIQWHPESMRLGHISLSRPRVYLIDFETAHVFSPDCPQEKRVLIGVPSGGSVTSPDDRDYRRAKIPEMQTGTPYDPFKLDVWQLATSLSDLRLNVPALDTVLDDMRSLDPDVRMDASVALSRLADIVHATPPQDLHIFPDIIGAELLPI